MPTEKLPDPPSDSKWVGHREAPCLSPDHNPPTMMVWPPGRYRHTCSGCGRSFEFTVRERY